MEITIDIYETASSLAESTMRSSFIESSFTLQEIDTELFEELNTGVLTYKPIYQDIYDKTYKRNIAVLKECAISDIIIKTL